MPKAPPTAAIAVKMSFVAGTCAAARTSKAPNMDTIEITVGTALCTAAGGRLAVSSSSAPIAANVTAPKRLPITASARRPAARAVRLLFLNGV